MIEVRFLLNNEPTVIRQPAGLSTLNWLRDEHVLTGTKEGCAEGECGACAVLLGEPEAGLGKPEPSGLVYRAVASCLLPVGELAGRHLVTIEGLDRGDELNAIQQVLVDEGAPQCGFCFPGIVVAITGYLLTCAAPDPEQAAAALDGNICRCTGYASTVRALARLCADLAPSLAAAPDRVEALVAARVLPDHFRKATAALAGLGAPAAPEPGAFLVGGGTDLLVQRAADLARDPVAFVSRHENLRGISRETDGLIVGGGVTIADLDRDPATAAFLPDLADLATRFGSALVRNRATIAGNLVNASPIGDLSVLLLAHDAELVLTRGGHERRLPLRAFFRGYKDIDLESGEILTAIRVPRLAPGAVTSYEKVSKRRNLDIASVNGAAVFRLQNDTFTAVDLAVGGVAPVPLVLERTAAHLVGKPVTAATLLDAAQVLDDEIAPIDDVRGSARYKRLLARRLFYAHVLKAAPQLVRLEELV